VHVRNDVTWPCLLLIKLWHCLDLYVSTQMLCLFRLGIYLVLMIRWCWWVIFLIGKIPWVWFVSFATDMTLKGLEHNNFPFKSCYWDIFSLISLYLGSVELLPLLFCAPFLSNFFLFIAGLFLLELLPVRVMFRHASGASPCKGYI